MTLRARRLARRGELLVAVDDLHQSDANQGRDEFVPLDPGELGGVQMLAGLLTGPHMFEHFVEFPSFSSAEKMRDSLMPAMIQIETAIGQASGVFVVRHHHDRAALRVEIAEDAEDDVLILGVEVSRGFVGEDDFRVVHKRAGDGDALLFTAGELGREMRCAVFHAYLPKRLHGLVFVRHAVEELRQHDVLDCRQVRHEMELLKDEANGFAAKAGQFGAAKLRCIGSRRYAARHWSPDRDTRSGSG